MQKSAYTDTIFNIANKMAFCTSGHAHYAIALKLCLINLKIYHSIMATHNELKCGKKSILPQRLKSTFLEKKILEWRVPEGDLD